MTKNTSQNDELIKKALIIFGVAMLWVTSTNFFAMQLTNLVGTYVIWPKPLSISELGSSLSAPALLPSKAASRYQKKSIGGQIPRSKSWLCSSPFIGHFRRNLI